MKTHAATHPAALLEANRRLLMARAESLVQPRTDQDAETWSDAVDAAQAAVERDIANALHHLLGEVHEDVGHALARLEAGAYGICEECSDPISPERLRALPEATRCVRCQRRRNGFRGARACA